MMNDIYNEYRNPVSDVHKIKDKQQVKNTIKAIEELENDTIHPALLAKLDAKKKLFDIIKLKYCHICGRSTKHKWSDQKKLECIYH